MPELQQILPGMTDRPCRQHSRPVSISTLSRKTDLFHTHKKRHNQHSRHILHIVHISRPRLLLYDLASFASHDQPSTHSTGAKDETETTLMDTLTPGHSSSDKNPWKPSKCLSTTPLASRQCWHCRRRKAEEEHLCLLGLHAAR